MKQILSFLLTLILVLALSPVGQAAETGDINFGVSVSAGADTIAVTVAGDNEAAIAELERGGSQLILSAPCDFSDAYTVRDAKLVDSALDTAGKKVMITAVGSGTYTVVKGTPPVVEMDSGDENARSVTVSEDNARYLKEISVPCDHPAEVYRGGKKVSATLSGGTLTIRLDGPGKYEIREAVEPPKETTLPSGSGDSDNSGDSAGGDNTSGGTNKTTKPSSTGTDVFPVTSDRFSQAMKKGNDSVVLKLHEAGQKAVSLPAASLKATAKGNLSLTLELPDVTLCLDSKALEALGAQARGATVELRYRVISGSELNTAQKEALKGHLEETDNRRNPLTFALSIRSEGLSIGDLKGGTLDVRIPFPRQPGTEEGSLALWRLGRTGGLSGYAVTLSDDTLDVTLDQVGEFAVVLDMPLREAETTAASEENRSVETKPWAELTPATETTPARGGSVWMPITAGICLLLALILLLVIRKYRKEA